MQATQSQVSTYAHTLQMMKCWELPAG